MHLARSFFTKQLKKPFFLLIVSFICLFLSNDSFANAPISYEDGSLSGGCRYDDAILNPSEDEKSLYESLINGSTKDCDPEESLAFESEGRLSESASKLPKMYDPRNTGKVTSQKCQGGWGLCWAFSAVATMESSLIASGLADENCNLSEMQFVYFAFLDQLKELKEAGKDPISFTEFCSMGGLSQAYDLLREGTGPINEDALTRDQELSDKFYLPEEYRKRADYNLQCVLDINMADINRAKQAVIDYGGVNVFYYSSEYFYLDLVNDSWDSSYYRPGNIKPPNHAVEVIGWDDGFSKDNFAASPDHDGAWLVKNSWGEEGYYQEYGSGYYWISYEEPSLTLLAGISVTFSKDPCEFVSEADDYGISIIDTRNPIKEIVIPSKMEIGGKTLPVTEIADTAFRGNKVIETITIGPNVEEIEPEAFKGCINLRTVTFSGRKLKDIGFDAFKDCKSLKTITLPATVEMVEERSFMGCSSLKSVTFGKRLMYIGEKAFYGCRKLKKITSNARDLHFIGKKAFAKTPKKKRLYIKKRKSAFKRQYEKAMKNR